MEASITQALTGPPNLDTRISAIFCRLDSLSIIGFLVPSTLSPEKKIAFAEGTYLSHMYVMMLKRWKKVFLELEYKPKPNCSGWLRTYRFKYRRKIETQFGKKSNAISCFRRKTKLCVPWEKCMVIGISSSNCRGYRHCLITIYNWSKKDLQLVIWNLVKGRETHQLCSNFCWLDPPEPSEHLSSTPSSQYPCLYSPK